MIQPTNQSMIQPTNQSMIQPTNQSMIQPTNQQMQQSNKLLCFQMDQFDNVIQLVQSDFEMLSNKYKPYFLTLNAQKIQ
jgi:hypothetical protein